jgi:hypothetical protein
VAHETRAEGYVCSMTRATIRAAMGGKTDE